MSKNKPKIINMLNDAMFKSIIRSKEARPLVNNFLHSLTHVEEEKLEKATYMGGEIAKKHIHEKGKSSDIIITVEDCKIILEMNQTDTLDIFDKNTSYAFALSTISTHISEKRKKVILINFDGFNRFKTDEPILVFRLQDEHGHIESELYLSFHLILENAKKSQYNIPKEVEEFMDFFTKYESIEELKEKYKGKEKFQSMVKKVEELTEDEEFLMYYDLEEKHKHEKQSSYELGIERGIEQGIEQGITKGSKQNSIEIAKKMLEKNKEISEIIEFTGLTKEEIESLK